MANSLQPLTYVPVDPVPSWSCGSHTGQPGLDRPTLAWFTRWREQDEQGRLRLSRTVLNRRQADALARLERNLLGLGCPLGWFDQVVSATHPVRLKPGILDRLLFGLGARPDCALDLARACRIPESACHHQAALEKALIAHLRPVEEPTSRPTSRDKKAATEAAPLTPLNNEKGTDMAISREAQRTARSTLIEMHARGELDLRQALPTGFSDRMYRETGIEQKAWRESATNLSIRADKLPEFGSEKPDPSAHLNGASGSNGHHPTAAVEPPLAVDPLVAERAKYRTKTEHIRAVAEPLGLLVEGASLPADTLRNIARIVDSTPGGVQSIIRDLRKKQAPVVAAVNDHAPAEQPQDPPKRPVQEQVDAAVTFLEEREAEVRAAQGSTETAQGSPETTQEPTPNTRTLEVKAAAMTDTCGHIWGEWEGEKCPRCRLVLQREQLTARLNEANQAKIAAELALDPVKRERDTAQARFEDARRIIEATSEALGDDSIGVLDPEELAGYAARRIAALTTEAEDSTQVRRGLETFLGGLAKQLGVEQSDEITAAVGALAGKASYLDEAVQNRNNALAQVGAYQRILEAVNDAIGGHILDGTNPDEMPDLVRQKVGNLQRDVDTLRGLAAAMGELCEVLGEPDPMVAVTQAGDCAVEVRDAHQILDRLNVDVNGEDGEPVALRDRIAWLADRQPSAPSDLAPASLAHPARIQVELIRPETGYALTPEDRQAALSTAAGMPVEASTDLHQRLARTLLVTDVLGVALR